MKALSTPMACGVVLVLAFFAGLACTETNLYSPDQPRKEASRLALTGRVCTEDPIEARFPVKVVMLVDQAPGPVFSDFDPAAERVRHMQEFIQIALTNDQVEMAIIGYAGAPRKIAPVEGSFTRNPGELFGAINSTSLQRPCIGEERCRSYREAIRTARSLIEGDIAGSPDGLRVLTQYVILHVNAGPHEPTAFARDCCQPDDVQCIGEGGMRSLECDGALSVGEVAGLREQVQRQGSAGLRYHVVHLAADEDADVNELVQDNLEQMAFAGGGTYQRFNAIGGLTANAFRVLNLRTVLTAKLLGAANLNALPGPDGPVVDSDGDGLSDAEEIALGTSPGATDTDGDGINDFVEVLLGLDPLVPEDPIPASCENIPPGLDRDLDGLTDCDEALLGTSPTLVDTDGDGLPDFLEAVSGTDYLNRDAESDTDGDGVTNADEILQRSDPRSTDAAQHLSFGYRYEIDDEGFVRDLFAEDPRRLTGIQFAELSPGTTAGIGTLVWNADDETLAWQDAGDMSPGAPISVASGGSFTLRSSSYAPIQGDDGRFVEVTVDPVNLPPQTESEMIRVTFLDRQCLNYTVRNIQLMPTVALDSNPDRPGVNNVLLYLAQGPEGRPTAPGPFRMAQIVLEYDPPNPRKPDDAILRVRDEEFVRPVIQPGR